MNTLTERIKVIAANEKLSIRALEKQIGASDGVISKALRAGTDVQAKWLLALSEKFPQYSRDWLLTGEGPMYLNRPEEKKEPAGIFIPAELAQMFGDMAATIRSQQEELRELRSSEYIRDKKTAAGL